MAPCSSTQVHYIGIVISSRLTSRHTKPLRKNQITLGPTSPHALNGPSLPINLDLEQNASGTATGRRSGSELLCYIVFISLFLLQLRWATAPLYHCRVPVQGRDAGALIAFSAFTTVDVHLGQKLSIYLTYLSDDSYTPSALAIRAGTGLGDLQDVRVVTFEKPEGWITFDISSEPNEEGEGL